MDGNDAELEAVDLGDVEELFRIGREITFEPGQVIFEGGDEGDSVFVVLEGEAQVDVGGSFLLRHPGLALSLLRTLVLRLREVEQRIDAWIAS